MSIRATRKEETHQRILHVASEAVRQRGFDGVGVADIMKRAGLTHGGFYAHFESKSDLLAAAVDKAGTDTLEALRSAARSTRDGDEWGALVDAYLSPAHVRHAEVGCPIAALGSDAPRQDDLVRNALAHRVGELAKAVEASLPASAVGDRKQLALASTAALVGALLLARATEGTALSRQILVATKTRLRELDE